VKIEFMVRMPKQQHQGTKNHLHMFKVLVKYAWCKQDVYKKLPCRKINKKGMITHQQ